MHPRRADYRLSAALVRAIRNSPLSLNAIGWPHGIAQPRMSAFIKGQSFSAATREKFNRIAESLGVSETDATRRVSR